MRAPWAWIGLVIIAALASSCRRDAPLPADAGEMVQIEGGTFHLGAVDRDRDARPCERPRHPVTLAAFQLDRYEVTLAEYEEAVAAAVVPEPSCPVRHEDERALCNVGVRARRNHPVNGVSWHSARAYCEWKGKRLPTEAEFEFALRAGRDDAIYPWGDERVPPADWGNVVGEESRPDYERWEQIAGYRDPYIGTSPVGSFEPNALGLHDMTGNVWEWCSDWYGERYYADEPRLDPTGPPSGDHKILRGGGFHCILAELRSAERHHKAATDDSFYSGFRCANDAP